VLNFDKLNWICDAQLAIAFNSLSKHSWRLWMMPHTTQTFTHTHTPLFCVKWLDILRSA